MVYNTVNTVIMVILELVFKSFFIIFLVQSPKSKGDKDDYRIKYR